MFSLFKWRRARPIQGSTWLLAVVSGMLMLSPVAQADGTTQNISENFTGTTTVNSWESINACLTAGASAEHHAPVLRSGQVPGCATTDFFGNAQKGGYSSDSLGSAPDPVGYGALRLTNDGNSESGGIFSTTPFDASSGVSITYITTSYEGDSGGAGADGADGIGFYLLDGSQFNFTSNNTSGTGLPLLSYNADATNITPVGGQDVVAHLGAWGGSLGYSCSNVNNPFNGMVGGYLGLGMDEYGNFMNYGDNTATGTGYHPSEIGMRGHGNVSWDWLNANYNSYLSPVPSSMINQVVKNTCKTGLLYTTDDSGNLQLAKNANGNNIPVADFAYLPNSYVSLPVKIANESATRRGQATPIYYKLLISAQGKMTFSYAINGGAFTTLINNKDITASNGPLPQKLYFGFGGSTGGSRNVHEITCFQAQPSDIASSSATANTQQTGAVQTSTQVYLAYYHPSGWWGSLQSYYLTTKINGGITTVSLNSTPNWDSTCTLTGASLLPTGVCPGGSASIGQSPSNRVILTWNPSTGATNGFSGQGVPFEWSNTDLSSTQQTALSSQNRLNFLRGDRSNELASGGTYRDRVSVLGDIQDSSPQWVGAPSSPYTVTWKDQLYPTATMQENSPTYASFKSGKAQREDVIYVGANDGLLHGFRSGYYTNSGSYVATTNDGAEVLAYMPQVVLNNIHTTSNNSLDVSNAAYAHQWYVDATPGVGDLYYSGAWHTWLVGGLGTGPVLGAATSAPDVYALGITNPTLFAETGAASIVKGDWTPATISCVNVSSCGNNLGGIYGDPQIRRLHNGDWGVIFGNGLNSANGTAGLFIMEIVAATGNIEFRYLDTGVAVGSKDGIATVAAADMDGDHITDYVYAGDLLGNVWRFDLTSNNPANWKVSSFNGSSSGSPLFTTAMGQPITTRLVLVSVPSQQSAQPRFMVEFGTGQIIGQSWNTAAAYATAQQAMYGIWDWNMNAWNTLNPAVTYATLTAPQRIAQSNLQKQTVTNTTTGSGAVVAFRQLSSNVVCWDNTSTCSSGNNQYGWVLNFPATGTSGVFEQVIYNPILTYGQLVFNTTIPPTYSIYNCNSSQPSGYTMSLNPNDGGATLHSAFSATVNGVFATPILNGAELNATGTPFVLSMNGGAYLVNQTVSGQGVVLPLNPAGNAGIGKRLNWMQLR